MLRVQKDKEEIVEKYDLSREELEMKISSFKRAALLEREKRIRPGLDNKIIAGWNGLTLTGLSHAYQAVQDSAVFELATQNAKFIKKELIRNGKLYRFPDKEMEGFLEDYAAIIQAFILFYETSLDREYLALAEELQDRVEEQFSDENEKLYFFTSKDAEALIARKKELFDNVIPSSNSILAWNLIHLGTHLYRDDLIKKGEEMIAQVRDLMIREPEYMSNWALSALEISKPVAEVIIVGPEKNQYIQSLNAIFIPNKIIAGSTEPKEEAPFLGKTMLDGKTTIYVCYDKTCKLPVTTLTEAVTQIQ